MRFWSIVLEGGLVATWEVRNDQQLFDNVTCSSVINYLLTRIRVRSLLRCRRRCQRLLLRNRERNQERHSRSCDFVLEFTRRLLRNAHQVDA